MWGGGGGEKDVEVFKIVGVRWFFYVEVKKVINNFVEVNVFGEGGYGKVL